MHNGQTTGESGGPRFRPLRRRASATALAIGTASCLHAHQNRFIFVWLRKSGEGETKMKNNAIRMFLALGAACVCVSALDAQPNALAAKVPFAFQVGDKTLPAGTYRVSEYGSTGVPILQNANTGDSIFVAGASHSLDPVRPGRLVF